MNRRLREILRAHVERRLLGLVVHCDGGTVKTIEVAEALVPSDMIGRDAICYCAGVGEDIALERFLADQLGAEVWAFDPTPRSIDYMARSPHDQSRIHFEPIGLWSEDATLHFHAPENPAYVSHSVMEDLGGGNFFDAPCQSIPNVMRRLGHKHLDLLKMNIEGAEHVVLGAALDSGVYPAVIMLTWEGNDAFNKARIWTKKLRTHGYKLIGRVGWYFTYVRG
jgi:FkbM family methyltransferase